MTTVVDVVNFNADASCLDSQRWLDALAGGDQSEFCRWLNLYVRLSKKMVLGLTGASLADLAAHNPEALGTIRDHPEVFESVVRPFSHDVALIRSPQAFALNLALGAQAVRRHFQRVSAFYLPPEFMLSNEQVTLVVEAGLEGVFVNAERLASGLRARIPVEPYWMRGLGGSRLRCLPVTGTLTRHYLGALHDFDVTGWNTDLVKRAGESIISWRDGESSFLISEGLEREEYWLTHEAGIERRLLSEVRFVFRDNGALEPGHLRSYPVHSFQAWMKEFRMIGFLGRVQRLEQDIKRFSPTELLLWLQTINSDVLSAVEKRSLVVHMRTAPDDAAEFSYKLVRSERGFEGEEYLRLLELVRAGNVGPLERFLDSGEPHATKLRGRLEYLQQLLASSGAAD